jgi:hypothetical protein
MFSTILFSTYEELHFFTYIFIYMMNEESHQSISNCYVLLINFVDTEKILIYKFISWCSSNLFAYPIAHFTKTTIVSAGIHLCTKIGKRKYDLKRI